MSEPALFEKESSQKLGAYQVISRIEKKYCAPSWAFFTEVKSSVGFGSRRADGIAVAMWRSLGLEIHGFEVKCSRADWLKELKDGGKSDEIFRYCDRWWVVVGDATIVRDGELPPTWGLQLPHGNGLKVAHKAPKLKPDPLTIWFLAEILRRQFDSAKRPETLELEYQRGLEDGKRQATPYDLKYQIEQSEKLSKTIEEFEKASGIRIRDWNSGEVGAAVRVVLDCGTERLRERLTWARNEVASTLKVLDEHIAGFRELP